MSVPDGDGKGNLRTGRSIKTSGDDKRIGGAREGKKTTGDTDKEKLPS